MKIPTENRRYSIKYYKENIIISEGDIKGLLDYHVRRYEEYYNEKPNKKGLFALYTKLKRAALDEKRFPNSKYASEHYKRKKEIKNLLAKNNRRRLAKNKMIAESKKKFILKVGFNTKDEPSTSTTTIPNFSSTFLLSPNLRKNSISFPVVIVGKSIDGKHHKAEVKVKIEMKMVGRKSVETKTDSKTVSLNLNPNLVERKNINLTLTQTQLDVNSGFHRMLGGSEEKTPQAPTISYEIISWD